MKRNKIALISAAVAAVALSSGASADVLLGWQLNLNSLSGSATTDNTGINNLSFNGESYIVNTLGGGGSFTFTDNGVFNVLQKNGGPALSLNGGEVTVVYSGGSGSGNLGTGSFTFNAGGTLNFYYDRPADYGSSAANDYGASNGTLIASFAQLAGGGGGINPNGTPTSNGQITALFQASSLDSSVWLDNLGVSLNPLLTIGFSTTNASEDPSANVCPGVNCTIDPNLVTALGATIPNNPPGYFLVSNGGQFKLETVPEPDTIALLGLGLLGLGLGYKRKTAA